MDDVDVRKRLQKIFRDVFGDPTIEIRDDMTAKDIEGWDSLAHVDLIIAVEQKMKMKFAVADISLLKEPGQNVGSFLRLIQQRLGS
jgi:acyl carrier protein